MIVFTTEVATTSSYFCQNYLLVFKGDIAISARSSATSFVAVEATGPSTIPFDANHLDTTTSSFDGVRYRPLVVQSGSVVCMATCNGGRSVILSSS